MAPLISIIIPTYNSAFTLTSCLKSIIHQSYDNTEILILDGGSNDGTVEIIKNFAFQNPNYNIQWISEKDKGIYDAMNKGINIAKGDWIYFLGSDDSFYNNAVLKTLFQDKDNKCYDVLYGNVYSARFKGVYDGVFDEKKILIKNICHQSIFFKTVVFKKIGNFNSAFKVHADWDHNMRWLLSKKIKNKYVDVVVANYADGGFSSTNNDEKFHESKKLIYLKYAHNLLSFNTKLTLFRDALYIKRKKYDLNGIFEILKFLPYVFFRF